LIGDGTILCAVLWLIRICARLKRKAPRLFRLYCEAIARTSRGKEYLAMQHLNMSIPTTLAEQDSNKQAQTLQPTLQSTDSFAELNPCIEPSNYQTKPLIIQESTISMDNPT
jgi:hypothetical protein